MPRKMTPKDLNNLTRNEHLAMLFAKEGCGQSYGCHHSGHYPVNALFIGHATGCAMNQTAEKPKAR